METKERPWVNDDSRAAVEERASFFCEITETVPPKLTFRKGKLIADDALLDWIKQEGVSLDWLAMGDPRCMIRVYRKNDLAKASFAEQLDQMDGLEKGALRFVLRAVVDKVVSAEDAFPMLFDMLGERRKQLPAS